MYDAEELILDWEDEVSGRDTDIDELELEPEFLQMGEEDLGDAISVEGVELEEEMQFIKDHFCEQGGELPLYLLVEDEYFEVGRISPRFDVMLSLASVGAGYRTFLHLGGKKLPLTEPDNLIRLIEI